MLIGEVRQTRMVKDLLYICNSCGRERYFNDIKCGDNIRGIGDFPEACRNTDENIREITMLEMKNVFPYTTTIFTAKTNFDQVK